MLEGLKFDSGVKLIRQVPEGLLAIDKPAGIKSHPNNPKGEIGSLLNLPYDVEQEAYILGDNRLLFLLNRLDSPTSGVLLMATDKTVTLLVKEAFAQKKVDKEYTALVKGVLMKQRTCWRDKLAIVRKGGQVRSQVVKGTANAESDVSSICRGKKPPARSLIRLSPKTGKTHQLRVQCASRNHPILGDTTYGDFRWNRSFKGKRRLYLHCSRTKVVVTLEGKVLSFEAKSPLPGCFQEAVDSF